MVTARYELSFEVSAIADEAEDALAEEFSVTVGGHSGVTVVTMLAEGETCFQAALTALAAMRAAGCEPLRLVDDLVGRGEIARRTGVTPQAVGQWVRGERHGGTEFPKPYVLGAHELWLWGEVVLALRARGHDVDADVQFPQRRDIQLIGGAIAAVGSAASAGWALHGAVRSGSAVSSVRLPRGQRAADSKRTDFALAS